MRGSVTERGLYHISEYVDRLYPGREWQRTEVRYALKRLARAMARTGVPFQEIEDIIRDVIKRSENHGTADVQAATPEATDGREAHAG